MGTHRLTDPNQTPNTQEYYPADTLRQNNQDVGLEAAII